MTIEQKHNCDCDKRNGTTNQTGHFNDCPLSCHPTVGEGKEDVCPHCGEDWSEAKMIGDPEYNDMWLCGKCKNEYGSPVSVRPSPTPNVGEEWEKTVDLCQAGHLPQGGFTLTSGEVYYPALKKFITSALSQREARVRDEATREAHFRASIDADKKIARVRGEAYEEGYVDGQKKAFGVDKERVRQETIAECVGVLEKYFHGLIFMPNPQLSQERILQALQSLSPNQK